MPSLLQEPQQRNLASVAEVPDSAIADAKTSDGLFGKLWKVGKLPNVLTLGIENVKLRSYGS